MRIVRSYTNVWKVEKMCYGINDWHLPRPVPMATVGWVGAFWVLSLFLKGIPPFIFTENVLMNHIALPVFFAWLASKAKFDGKTPHGFFRSVFRYAKRPHGIVRGKAVRLRDMGYTDRLITVGKRMSGKEGGNNAAISD